MLAVLAALGTLSGVVAGPAVAGSHMEIGLQDDAVFLTQYWYGRAAGLARARDLHVTWIRSNLVWTQALTHGEAKARKRPKRLTYDVSRWDTLIDAAAAQGIRVELTLTGPSPPWATASGRGGPFAPRLSDWRDFVRRMAAHFKGRVSRYEIWNEPNYVGWIQPLREAPYIYRGLYQTAWGTIHKVDPKAQVLIGDTSPYVVAHKAWAPLTFLRAMACVDGRYKRLKGCTGTLVADGYAQHAEPADLGTRQAAQGPRPAHAQQREDGPLPHRVRLLHVRLPRPARVQAGQVRGRGLRHRPAQSPRASDAPLPARRAPARALRLLEDVPHPQGRRPALLLLLASLVGRWRGRCRPRGNARWAAVPARRPA
jgi:hypothetical protein